jgi:SAM-dependent methyltransferase
VGGHLDLFAGANVLEVGCGSGWLWTKSSFPVSDGVRLTLTDLSPGMVEEAMASVRHAGRVASVAGRPADLPVLPFEDSTFDRVLANHMLYHLPEPALGVAELARVVWRDGRMIAATNGRSHLKEMWELRARVFGTSSVDETTEAFNPEIGFELFRRWFSDVRWVECHDTIVCTDPADIVAYVCSVPPAESASADELAELTREVGRAFDQGEGTFTVTKEVGCFICTNHQ